MTGFQLWCVARLEEGNFEKGCRTLKLPSGEKSIMLKVAFTLQQITRRKMVLYLLNKTFVLLNGPPHLLICRKRAVYKRKIS